ncbi:BamA/TamA family outer membrane protein [candidate division KSB1 bacterium]|nr:BamA/TamA family outer membrane protein [candidate division KSB1 bacterium]
MKRIFQTASLLQLCTALFFLSASRVPAFSLESENDSLCIRSIVVVGNEKTRDYIILREMRSRPGQPLDWDVLQADRKRIENLLLFNRVDIQAFELTDGVAVLVVVVERWYLFPAPIFYANEHDMKKLSYGLAFIHQNFRGQAIVLQASAWGGFNPGFDFSAQNPWIGGSANLYAGIQVYTKKIRSRVLKVERFYETHRGISLTLGKRWGHHFYTSAQCGYRTIGFPDDFVWLTSGDAPVEHLPSIGLSLRYDRRDRIAYPRSGLYLSGYGVKIIGNRRVDSLQSGMDARVYLPLGAGISLAARSAADIILGNRPQYLWYTIGYSERVRGRFHQRAAADSRALGSLELRFPLVPITHVSFGEDEFISAYAQDMPFGVSGAFFYDGAVLWRRSTPPASATWLDGWGLGLHFHLPYIHLLRIEAAWNSLEGKPEYLVDIGVWF